MDGSKTSVLLKNTAKRSVKRTKSFKSLKNLWKKAQLSVKTWEFNKNLLHIAYDIFQLFKVRFFCKNTLLESYDIFTNFWQLFLSIYWARTKNTNTVAVIGESLNFTKKLEMLLSIRVQSTHRQIRRTKRQSFFPLIEEKCWIINNHLAHHVRYIWLYIL